MSEENNTEIECRLCRKKIPWKKWGPANRIDEWRKVCDSCIEQWKVGKRAMGVEKKEAKDKMIGSSTPNHLPNIPKFGDPKGPTEITAKDVITAIGGVTTRGTSERFFGHKTDIEIVEPQDKEEFYTYINGGSQKFQVQKSRAEAMKKIVTAFLNAIAKAKVEGMQEGRGLLAGLAKGTLQVADFSEISDRLAKGRKPKRD